MHSNDPPEIAVRIGPVSDLAGTSTGSSWAPMCWLVALIAVGCLAPFIPVPNAWSATVGSILFTILYVTAVVQLVVAFARVRLSPIIVVFLFATSMALWYLLEFHIVPGQMQALAHRFPHGASKPQSGALVPLVIVRALRNVALLASSALAGTLLSRLISEPNMVAPICALIALIDIWGVLFGGLVSQMLKNAPTVSAKAMAPLPSMGAATGSHFAIPLPDIGAGDYLFLGMLFAALTRLDMNWRGAVQWVTPLVIGALLGVVFGIPALPGLLFIGLGVALPNRRYFHFTREEKFALLWAAALVGLLTVGLFFAAPYIAHSAHGLEPVPA